MVVVVSVNNIVKDLVQVELESSGVCNLNCSYCYIPKDVSIQGKINQSIIKAIENGDYLKYIEKLFGNKLESLSLWGTEPTLNIPVMIKYNFFDDLFRLEPNLNSISLSTNLISNYNRLYQFYEHINQLAIKYNKPNFKIDVQLSIDGHKPITDKNRGNGMTEKILDTLYQLQDLYSKPNDIFSNITIYHHFKPTFDGKDIEFMISNESEIDNYISFFNDICAKFQNVNSKIRFSNYITPTLQLPEEFDMQDGINFAKLIDLFIDRTHKYNKNSFAYVNVPYEDRFKMTLYNYPSLNTNLSRGNSVYTCSQGDTMVGISSNGNIGMCHHLFFLYDNNFNEMWMNMDSYKFKNKDMKYVIEKYLPHIDNYNDIIRFFYSIRTYHDYIRFKIDNTQMMLYRLKKYGHCKDSLIYQSEEYVYLFSLFLISAFACPIVNLLSTGTFEMLPISIFNIFANGQFEKLFKYVIGSGRNE